MDNNLLSLSIFSIPVKFFNVQCVHREPTTPKLKMSDFGVISPRSASGAMYARVPTILSVIMVVEVRLADALVSPKSEIFATILSSSRMFALRRQSESQSRAVCRTSGTYLAKLYFDLSQEEISLSREEAHPQFHKDIKDKFLLLASGFCLVRLMSFR